MGDNHLVHILWCGGKHTVVPAIVEVNPGDTIEFLALDSEAKISFPDSEAVGSDGWGTTQNGNPLVLTVAKQEGEVVKYYYYTVMCKHEDGYWYGEGNSCPAMKLK